MGLILWVGVFLLLFNFSNALRKIDQPEKVSASEIKTHFLSGKVKGVVFEIETLNVQWEEPANNPPAIKKFIARAAGQGHFNELVALAEKEKIPFDPAPPPNYFWQSLLSNLLWVVLLVVFWIWMMKKQTEQVSGRGGPFGFGQSKAKLIAQKAEKTFADVAGCEEAKEEIKEIVDFLKNPSGFARLGARIPKGVLLYGLPGTGKTLLAKAVAGEAGVPFLSTNGSKFIEMFVGVGASRVRDLFESARKLAPCVVFIDEIDAVGKKRGFAIGGGHDEREQTLDALLEELDGFDKNCGIVVMAATNRPDILDEALVRPGRFDRQIMVPKPELTGREMILKIHARNAVLGPEVNLLEVAKDTAGMVGADLENVVNEAVLIATRKKKDYVEQSDFSEAVDKVSMGPARKSVKLTEKEKQRTAYHEAGHTLAAMLTEGADPVHKVTIIPRGPALGFTKQLPEDRHSITKKELEAMVAVCVAGRAAEEVKFGEITTGHSNDFEKATLLLKKMIYELGMDEETGMAVYKEKADFWGNPTGLDASQKTKELLERAVKTKLAKIYNDVKELLVREVNKLDKLAGQLMEKETLDANEIRAIINSS